MLLSPVHTRIYRVHVLVDVHIHVYSQDKSGVFKTKSTAGHRSLGELQYRREIHRGLPGLICLISVRLCGVQHFPACQSFQLGLRGNLRHIAVQGDRGGIRIEGRGVLVQRLNVKVNGC